MKLLNLCAPSLVRTPTIAQKERSDLPETFVPSDLLPPVPQASPGGLRLKNMSSCHGMSYWPSPFSEEEESFRPSRRTLKGTQGQSASDFLVVGEI